MTATQEHYLNFWTKFKACVAANQWPLNMNRKPAPRYYHDISFGHTGIHLSLHIPIKEGKVYTGIYIKEKQKEAYRKLLRYKKEIEASLGPVDWIEDTGKGVARLKQSIDLDVTDKANREYAFNWLGEKSSKFQEVVKLYLEE